MSPILNSCIKYLKSTVYGEDSDKSSPSYLIRKCPKCGEIWVLTEACDGATTCGNKIIDNINDF